MRFSNQERRGGRGHLPDCTCRVCARLNDQPERPAQKAERIGGPLKRARNAFKKRAFVRSLTEPNSKTFLDPQASALAVGYERSDAERLLQDRGVRSRLLAAMEKQGITDEYLARVFKEGMEANEVKLASSGGTFTDQKVVPDHDTRIKYLELFLRIRGDLAPEQHIQQAALIVQLPSRELVAGHGACCRCRKCELGWEETAMRGEEVEDGNEPQ